MAALLPVQQNLATEMQGLAEDILVIKNRIAIAVAMFSTEGMGSIADIDLQALPEFAHVTSGELTGAKSALDAINTTMGEYIVGSNTTKLMKIVLRVPK